MTDFASKKLVQPLPTSATAAAATEAVSGGIHPLQKIMQLLTFLNDARLDFESYARSSPSLRLFVGVALFFIACALIYALANTVQSLRVGPTTTKKEKAE